MENVAAWLVAKQARPLVVKPAALPEPGPGELLVKCHYVAMNPADWKMIKWGHRMTKFPAILGQDIGGEIVQVGDGVTDQAVGDRVIAHLLGVVLEEPTQGAFQLYAIARAIATAQIPPNIAYEDAVVLPLAVSTATVGLYTPLQLHLPLPTVPARPSSGDTIIIWGGASSVGSVAIQLARASGLAVATTCSPRNSAFVQELGASLIFDYSSPTIREDMASELKSRTVVGAFNAIGGETSNDLLIDILAALPKVEGRRKHVATVPPAPESDDRGVTVAVLGSAAQMFLDESRLHIGEYMWRNFLPKALVHGILTPSPQPMIVGEGLPSIQQALDILEKGVSARKVVVKVQ